MHQFFVEDDQVGKEYITITGSDVNHIKKALRMRPGEKIRVSTSSGRDYYCIISTNDNFAVNKLDGSLGDFYVGDLTGDEYIQSIACTEKYDIVVANILADVIIPMAPVIPSCLKSGGIFISSGIIDFKEEEVCRAIEDAGMEIVERGHEGEWVSITALKI